MDVLMKYRVKMVHLSPNAVRTLATFSHFYEAFVGVMPFVCMFHRLFKMSKNGGDDRVGCVRISVHHRESYIK